MLPLMPRVQPMVMEFIGICGNDIGVVDISGILECLLRLIMPR